MENLAPTIRINTEKYYHSHHPRGYGNWGIECQDHIIIGDGRFVSLRREKMIDTFEN